MEAPSWAGPAFGENTVDVDAGTTLWGGGAVFYYEVSAKSEGIPN